MNLSYFHFPQMLPLQFQNDYLLQRKRNKPNKTSKHSDIMPLTKRVIQQSSFSRIKYCNNKSITNEKQYLPPIIANQTSVGCIKQGIDKMR